MCLGEHIHARMHRPPLLQDGNNEYKTACCLFLCVLSQHTFASLKLTNNTCLKTIDLFTLPTRSSLDFIDSHKDDNNFCTDTAGGHKFRDKLESTSMFLLLLN